MPLHRDATYVNLHPPLGASLDTSDQPLNLLESAYAMHWRNHNARDVLLVDTSFANSTRITLGNSTDPTYLVLPGASIVEADRAIFPVRGSDPSEPGTGVALYSKDVAGVDHLFARVDDGTIYQLTPPASGSFDPEDIALADNTADALDIYEGANKYLTVATTNGSEAVRFGNATTNPSFTFSGSGALTLPTGHITIPDNTATAFRVREAANNYLAVTTTNSSESMSFGNATTNPAFSFLGSGAVTLSTGGISIPDNSATSFRVLEGANSYLTIDTTNGAERIVLGNAATNPVIELATSSRIAQTGNLVWGNFSVIPSGTGGIRIGSKSSGTDTGNDNIVIGASTGNNAGSRFVSISAGGRTGNASTDSITIQSIGGTGATGTRGIIIGGAAGGSGGEIVGIGYAVSLNHAYAIGFGRGATSTATNQFIVGGDGHPTTDFYLGEGVNETGGFVATAITIQPTQGTGTNRDGLPITYFGGRGTGTGNGASPTNGSLTLATYPSTGSSGTTQHTAHPRVRVRADGVRLSSSHNTMSTAAERDEAEHFQTGAVDMPTASTTYTVLTIAPENTANDSIYTVEGMITGYADTTPAARISFFYRLTFECVSGTLSIIRYWILDMETGTTGWVSGSPPWADVSGSTVRIRVSTAAGQTDGRAIATARWHGVEL